jgi:hypothetical protein
VATGGRGHHPPTSGRAGPVGPQEAQQPPLAGHRKAVTPATRNPRQSIRAVSPAMPPGGTAQASASRGAFLAMVRQARTLDHYPKLMHGHPRRQAAAKTHAGHDLPGRVGGHLGARCVVVACCRAVRCMASPETGGGEDPRRVMICPAAWVAISAPGAWWSPVAGWCGAWHPRRQAAAKTRAGS